MRGVVALALAVLAVMWVRTLGATVDVGSAGTALALGFTLLGASIAGDIFRRFHLPRLSGYLLFGVVTGPYLGNVISESMAGQLQVITGLATTVIALIAGLSLNFERLGERFASITRMTATMLGVAMAVLLAVTWLAWPLIATEANVTAVQRLAMAGLTVLMIVSLSPTMTAAVTAESGARGRLSELVLAMVILADLALLVLFSLVLQLARAAFNTGLSDVTVIARFAWEVGGAVAFGALVGALFALYVRYVGREVTLALIVMCGLLSQVGTTQQFEPLLAAVSAGLVIENLSVAQGEALKAAVQRGAPPILVIFFVAVGASLQVATLATVGLLALAVAVIRIVAIRLGLAVGLRGAGVDAATGAYVWTGLISQAGITLGLASIVAVEYPGWGTQAQTLIVALIALHEIVGPVVFRYGLARAGDLDSTAARPLLVVSNREPYLHSWNGHGGVAARPATGGVAVALDALMRERGGTWIAHGAGDADRQTVDAGDKIRVPPSKPAYDLRRLWISPNEFAAYYGGFANEGLWPLCHLVDVRPKFRTEDWTAYRAVNAKFAAAIDAEMPAPDTPVFLQDYHLAMARSEERRVGKECRSRWRDAR